MPSKNKSARVSAQIAAWIKWLYANTQLNQAQIAALFNLNQGRVSEIINGARFPNIAPQPYNEGDFA